MFLPRLHLGKESGAVEEWNNDSVRTVVHCLASEARFTLVETLH